MEISRSHLHEKNPSDPEIMLSIGHKVNFQGE